MNNMREIIPNYVMSFGFFQCSAKNNLILTKGTVAPSERDICECVGSNCVDRNFFIMEKIVYPTIDDNHIGTFRDLIEKNGQNLTVTELGTYIGIIILALSYGQRDYGFLHNDFNTRNAGIHDMGLKDGQFNLIKYM